MAGFQQRLANPQYANWLKAGLCLITLKEGLATFTEAVVKDFHCDILASLPGTAAGAPPACGSCVNNDISFDRRKRRWSINCPICDKIVETLQEEHVFDLTRSARSAWNNTDVRQWCSDAWEISKVYMNPGQKPTNKSPSDSDCSGLVNLVLHCKKFHGFIAAVYNNYEQIRNHRNDVMHSKSMEVTDAQLTNVVQDIVIVLRNLDHCYTATKAEPTLKKLRSSLTSTQTRLQQTQSKLAQTQSTLAQTQSKLAQTQSTLAPPQSTLAQTQSSLAPPQSTLAQTQSSLTPPQSTLAQTQSTLAPPQSTLAQTQSSLTPPQSTLAQTQSTLATSQSTLAQTQSTLAPPQSTLAQTQSSLAPPQSTLAQTQSSLAPPQSTLAQTQSKLAQTQSKLAQTQSTLAPPLSTLAQTQSTLAPPQSTLAQTQSKLAQTQSTLAQTQSSLAPPQSTLAQTQSTLAQTQSTLAPPQSTLAQTQSSLAPPQSTLAQTQSKLAQTQSTLAQTQSSLAPPQSTLAQTQSKLAQTQSTLAQTKSSLAPPQSTLAQTHSKLAQTQSTLAPPQSTLAQTQSSLAPPQSTLAQTQSKLAQTQSTLAQTQSTLAPPQSTLPDGQQILSALKQARRSQSFSRQSKTSQILFDQAIDFVAHALSAVGQLESPLSQKQVTMQHLQLAVSNLDQTVTVSNNIQTSLDQAAAALTQEQAGLAQPQPTYEQVNQAVATTKGAVTALDQAESMLSQTDTTMKQTQSSLQTVEQGLSVWQQAQHPLQQATLCIRQALFALEKADNTQWDEAVEERNPLQEAVAGMKCILFSLDNEEQGLYVLPAALADVKQTRGDLDHKLAEVAHQQSSLNNARCDLKQAMEALTALQQVIEVRDSTLELTTQDEMLVVRDKMDALEGRHQVMNQRITALDVTGVKTEEDIADLKQTSISQETGLKKIATQYESLKKLVDQIGKDNHTLTAKCQGIVAEIQKRILDLSSLSNKILAVDQKVAYLERRQRENERALTTSQERQQVMQQAIATSQERQQEMQQVIATSQERQQEMQQVIATSQERQQEMQQVIATSQERQQEMKQAINTNQECQQTINEETDGRLSTLEQTVPAKAAREESGCMEEDETRLTEFLCESYKDEEKVPVLPLHREVSLSQIFAPIVIREDLENGDGEGNPGVSSISTPRSRETNTQISSYFDMFHKEKILQKNIYMLGQAGSGKTTFCKHLVDIWCSPSVTGQYKEIEVIREFEFVFLVKCRNAKESDTILDMIFKQCLCDTDSLRPTVSQVLRTKPEKCLILIDGLDEWAGSPSRTTGPRTPCGLPSRQGLENCVVLTTSRPWRVEALTQGLGKHHRILEIQGLTDSDMKTLSKKVLSALKVADVSVALKAFLSDVKHAKLTEVVRTPLMLIIVLTFWHEAKRKLDRSVCVNFSGLLESLIQRAEGRSKRSDDKNRLIDIPHFDSFKESLTKDKKQLPSCFRNMAYCGQYSPLIHKLAQFAFNTLFRDTQERSLVFSQSDLKQIFNETELSVCLNIGILSLATAPVKSDSMENRANVSFLHKSLQEYLAALWMASDSFKDCLAVFKSHCKSLTNVFDYSKVVLFACGLAPVKGRELWSCIGEVTRADPVLQEHRQTVTSALSSVRSEHPATKSVIRLYQLALDCSTEASHSQPDQPGRHLYHYMLPDVYVGEEMSADQRGLVYDQVQARPSEVKSLIIDDTELAPELEHNLHKLVSLERLHIELPYTSSPSPQQCSRLYSAVSKLSSLRSLYMRNCWSTTDSDRLLTLELHSLPLLTHLTLIGRWSVTPRPQLSLPVTMTALTLYYVELSHSSMESLTSLLGSTASLQQLDIRHLQCLDCGRGGHDIHVDLVQHSQLEQLVLSDVYGDVQTVRVGKDTRSLRSVRLRYIQMSAGAWRSFLLSLPRPAHRLTVGLYGVNIDADIVADIERDFTVTRNNTPRARHGRRDIEFHSGVPP